MDVDVGKIHQTLEELRREPLPLPVRSWRIKTGLDWMDSPAIWVWAVLRHGDVRAREKRELREELRETVADRVWEEVEAIDDEFWVFVDFDEEESATAQ